METTIKEITIKEIDAAYETLERVLGMSCMESIKDVLWQNFSGQAAGATMTGAEILRKMGDEASAKEIYNYYSDVVAPKFEKLYRKIVGVGKAQEEEQKMKFYFNDDENACMTEDDVVEYLHEITEWKSEYIREKLHTCRDYYGWYECKVSDTIKEKFSA